MDRIKLNVGGCKFETTRATLAGSEYFTKLLELSGENEIFIDRSGILFEHVLCLLRNPDYEYPMEHIDELRVYGIHQKVGKTTKDLEREIRFIHECINKCKTKWCKNEGYISKNPKVMRKVRSEYCSRCIQIREYLDNMTNGERYLFKSPNGGIYVCTIDSVANMQNDDLNWSNVANYNNLEPRTLLTREEAEALFPTFE